jgi:pimeloyl-ACP methyl ester carboxylesterase
MSGSRLVSAWFFQPLVILAGFLLSATFSALPAFAENAPETEEKIPDPEDVDEIVTKDGVPIKATFYPSLLGKKAVPIILLHGFKGDRRDFDGLALDLQKLGHAVIVPDLRGHGDSSRVVTPGTGAVVTIEPGKLRKDDFLAMVSQDVEAVKKFLMKKNNAGELNIDKLCVVGADMGATIALNWAVLDWSWAPLSTGKQGQDVKALVLISPEWAFRGMPITDAMSVKAVRRDLSIMLIAGKGSKSMGDASRIFKGLEKLRPAPPSDPKEAAEKQDLFFDKPSTSLQGTKMLGEKSLNLNPRIAKFIELRLVDKNYPWTNRSTKPE